MDNEVLNLVDGLSPATSEAVLHVLQKRTKRDLIYTWLGETLIAVNPYNKLITDGRDHDSPLRTLLDRIHRRLVSGFETSHSALLFPTGESGSGKTVTTVLAIDYFISKEYSSLQSKLESALAVLHAFGNGKTLRNDNASRFCLLLELEFDFKGVPQSANINTYLLDKWNPGNFHIFQNLLWSADPALLKCLHLNRNIENYAILRPYSNSLQIKESNMKEHIDNLSLCSNGIYRILAAILKLGNVNFIPIAAIDGTEGSSLHPLFEVGEAASLLGVRRDDLCKELTNARGVCLSAGAGEERRNVLIRAIYSRLFVYISKEIATQLTPFENGLSACSRISFLDIPGFQIFEHNAFEELIINVANERLEAALVDSKLRAIQEEYVREGIPWVTVDTRVMIPRQNFPLEEVEFVVMQPPNCPVEHRERESPFRIKHFGGTVHYGTGGAKDFQRKNSETVGSELARLLYSADHPILPALFPEGAASYQNPHSTKQKPCTAWTQMEISLKHILALSKQSSPYYIRCIKPNELKIPGLFEPALVLHQIKCQRLLDFLRVYRDGFAFSVPIQRFIMRYKLLSLLTWPQFKGGYEGAHLILRDLHVSTANFTIGRHSVFLKDSHVVDELEELRRERLDDLAILIQKTWRGWREFRKTRKTMTSMKECEKVLSEMERQRLCAVRRIERCYIRWKRVDFLLTLASDLPPKSPCSKVWPKTSTILKEPSFLIYKIFHRWRCVLFRQSLSDIERRKMREKVTASVLFSNRKVSYAKSVGHPFLGDYVCLRQNPDWHSTDFLVFADLVNKVTRSGGKLVPVVLVVTTCAVLILDPRSLHSKERIDAQDIIHISVSPFSDDIAVLHISGPGVENQVGHAGCSGAEVFKGDVIIQSNHLIELVTKVFLVVQNALGKPPIVSVSSRFQVNFGTAGKVEVNFKCQHRCQSSSSSSTTTTATSSSNDVNLRVTRKSGRLEFTVL